MWRLWAGWILRLVCLALLVHATPALAHPKIVETVPAENAQLASSPAEVRMVFDEPLEAALSQIAVFDAQREQVGVGGGRAPDEPTVLRVALPPLTPGVYTVVWQTVGTDGHVIKGNFAFSLIGAAPSATPAGQASEVLPPAATAHSSSRPSPAALPAATDSLPGQPAFAPIVPAVLRALMVLGVLATLGSWASAALALPAGLVEQSPRLRQRLRGLQIAGLAALALGIVGIAVLHTLVTTGTLSAANLLTVIGATRFGQALLARLLLGLGLLLVLILPGAITPWRQALAGLLGGGLLLTFALAGHAGAQEQLVLPVLADWLHLAATVLWVGGLLVLVLVLPAGLAELNRQQRVAVLASLIQRFSPLALLSVLLLALTGGYSALLHLNSLNDLWNSAYGQALLAKLIFFAALLAVGAYQLMRVRPGLEEQPGLATPGVAEKAQLPAERWQQRFFRLLRIEAGLALLLLVAVGFLTSLAPPEPAALASTAPARGPTVPATAEPTSPVNASVVAATQPLPTRTPVPSQPFSQTQTLADLQLRLEVRPASINQNQFEVEVRDQNGQPLEVQLVRLTAEMLEMDMGTRQLELAPQGGGRYRGEAPRLLSMVGDWQLRLLVRRVDAPDVEAIFTVPVGE